VNQLSVPLKSLPKSKAPQFHQPSPGDPGKPATKQLLLVATAAPLTCRWFVCSSALPLLLGSPLCRLSALLLPVLPVPATSRAMRRVPTTGLVTAYRNQHGEADVPLLPLHCCGSAGVCRGALHRPR
jgi:hypothetical protein